MISTPVSCGGVNGRDANSCVFTCCVCVCVSVCLLVCVYGSVFFVVFCSHLPGGPWPGGFLLQFPALHLQVQVPRLSLQVRGEREKRGVK